MTERRVVVLAALVALVALAADARAQEPTFPASDRALRAALCPTRGGCRFDFVLDAGMHGDRALAVVRVRSGPLVCCEEHGYRDYLVSSRAGVVRRERLLVRGTCPCLEWERSSWAYRRGELIFRYGGMGAPPGADADLRPTTLHLTPSPLAITASYRGDSRDPVAATLPARGPLVVLSME